MTERTSYGHNTQQKKVACTLQFYLLGEVLWWCKCFTVICLH